MAIGANQPPQLTKLAQKYTHPMNRCHKIIAKTGKSGLTSIEPLLQDAPPLSEAQLK